MSKMLALLSGKGGSGKTTLALSMASMLSNCGIKVLLIDCDLSTNGATYFYENKLSEYDGNTISFYNFLFDMDNGSKQLININKYMDFMPSIVQITKKTVVSYLYKEADCKIIYRMQYLYADKYDVIIFDCQAGYTDVLKLVLPMVDINLVIMEADAISSAAIRSLYLKIGDVLNEKKIFQIFNKATDEEYQIYSKISGGTVFTNIETVMFDWKIRKAFSVAEIPDMENTSAGYGMQIYNICKILFKEENIQERLNKFGIVIELNKNAEEEEQLEAKISDLQKEFNTFNNKMNKIIFTTMLGVISGLLCYLFYQMIVQKVLSYDGRNSLVFNIMLVTLVTVLSFAFFIAMDSSKERRSRYKQADIYRKQLEAVIENKKELQNEYEVFNIDKM